MGKVIAFDKSRLRSSSRVQTQAQEWHSQLGMRSNARIHPFSPKKEDVTISVIVVSHGRPHLLGHCLASLLFQQFEASRYEIIVVDEKPNRATRDIVNDWARHASRNGPLLSYIAGVGNDGLAAARNRGWRAARGAVVAYTDDDTVARPDWLMKGMQALETEAAQAVWGRVIAPGTPSPAPSGAWHAATEKLQPFMTSNYFVRKAALEDVGGFDERFKFAWGEESDLYFRLSAQRARVVHYPQAVMTRPSHTTAPNNSLTAQRSHQAEVLLSRKHPQLYRQKMAHTPYAASYLVTVALLLGVAFALAGATTMAFASTALWMVFMLYLWQQQSSRLNQPPPRTLAAFFTALFTPPLTAFWHARGWLRFRRITE